MVVVLSVSGPVPKRVRIHEEGETGKYKTLDDVEPVTWVLRMVGR